MEARPRPREAVAIFAAAVVLAAAACREPADPMQKKRSEMVHGQIAARGIRDPRVLEAMRAVPRHLFVPTEETAFAYDDRPLPIGSGQTISQPYVVAFMAEQLRLTGNEKVLEIGTGSGYSTAILAALAAKVFSIEIRPELAREAKERLANLGVKNVELRAA
ncbi:MAG TPA: rRNA adenine N-6-methyltransferase family protein, partial [Thermoanaerobaculia bacterium]|nr:rRNA adenine N-6-methyltransferase family protein [Thermoanaerobaculia bacterium]